MNEDRGPRRVSRRAEFDAAAIRKEVAYIVRRARARDTRVVSFGPLVFFSTATGDAWMLDPEDGAPVCLCRDGEAEIPVQVEDLGEQVAIRWECEYRIEGDAFTFAESGGRLTAILGYPGREIEAQNWGRGGGRGGGGREAGRRPRRGR
jgi:hypothetical protein